MAHFTKDRIMTNPQQSLAQEITSHTQKGASLFAIGTAIKHHGIHIEAAAAAFRIAGYDAQPRIQTVLGVRVITLTITDSRDLARVDQALADFKASFQVHGFTADLEERLQAIVNLANFPTEGKTATIDWTNGNF